MDCCSLAAQTAAWTTHLDEVVCQEPTHLGFCDALGLGYGGAQIDPLRSVHRLVWPHPSPSDIIDDLVLVTNLEVQLINSNLELAAFNLHEATLFAAFPAVHMATPCFGSENTPNFSWSAQ